MNTATVHEWTGPTGVKFRDVREPSGTYYHDTTPRPVIDALERAMANDSKVRIFLGDRETGKPWMEEHDVVGTIGRSMGPIKIPLMIANSRSSGGPAILCDCIIRMMVGGREVYRHPKYQEPVFTMRTIKPDEMASWHVSKPKKSLHELGLFHCVQVNGEDHANFKSLTAATRWIAFMKGERMCK